MATGFSDQESKINHLKSTLSAKNEEMTNLRKQVADADIRTQNLTLALTAALQKEKAPVDKELEPTQSADVDVVEDEEKGEMDDENSDDETKPYTESKMYKDAIDSINLDEFNPQAEASRMLVSSEAVIEGNHLLYPVPTHLMGLVVGKGKKTLRRIYYQTHTEIEQRSWSLEDGEDSV